MKKYLRFAENYILLLASATLGLFLLLFAPKDGGVSETENRALQAFPELKASSVLSGEYMDEFESFLSDAFPAREKMIALSDAMMSIFGEADEQEKAKKVFVEEQGLVGDEAPEALASEPPRAETPEARPDAAAPAEDELPAEARGAALWLVRSDGKIKYVEQYSAETVEHVARVVNRYRDALGADGRLFLVNSPASGKGCSARFSVSDTPPSFGAKSSRNSPSVAEASSRM